jgi:hypothetical protein
MNDFFAKVFELGGMNVSTISDPLYDEGLYTGIGLSLIIVTLLSTLIYYVLVDSSKYNRWNHWLGAMIISAIIVVIFIFFYAKTTFDHLGLGVIGSEYINVMLTGFVYSLLGFFVFSMGIKYFSKNARRTPF